MNMFDIARAGVAALVLVCGTATGARSQIPVSGTNTQTLEDANSNYITIANTTFINDGSILATLTNVAAANVINNGNISGGGTAKGGAVPGLINNQGATATNNDLMTTVSNSGVFNNSSTGVVQPAVDPSGALYAGTGVTNSASGVVNNAFGGTMTGPLNNQGGQVNNSGAINGNVVNGSGGVIVNSVGGVITSNGTIPNGNNGSITLNGTFTNNFGASVTNSGTINGGISNFGTVSNSGGTVSGLVVNSGAFTNSGGTISGNVQNNSGGNFTNSGTITGTSGNTVSNSGTFSNTGSGVIDGGAGNDGGGTFTNGGMINGGFTNNSSSASISAQALTIGNATNNGTINGGFTNNSNSVATNNSGATINGGVTNWFNSTFTNNAGGTINGQVFNNSGGTFTNAGLIVPGSGSTVTNTSGGTFNNISGGTISGAVSNFGAFNNNGTVSGTVTNNPGGSVSGNGTVGSLDNAGAVSPGNSIGTLAVGGDYVHRGTGSYQVEVNGSGQSDRLKVGGAASLQGGTVNVHASSGTSYAARTTYTVLTAAGGVSGSLASLTDPSPFLQASLSYDASNVYLTLQIGGFAAAAQTPTQAAVGAALDAGVSGASGDFATILGTIAPLGSSQVLPFLTSISGQNYSAFSNSMVQGAQLFMNNFALQVGGGSVGRGGGRMALAEACEVACQTTTPALWGAWGGALGGTGTVGAGTSIASTTYNVGGFAGGLDRLLAPNFLAGVTVGYTTGTQWVSGFSGQSATNTVQAGIYGSFFQGPVYLDGMASYAYSTNQMWRNIAIPNLQQRTAQGLTGANQFFGQLEGGYRVDLGGTAMAFITPFARLQGYTGTQNGFMETGAQSLSLTVAAQTTSSLRSVIGAQLGGSMDLGWRDRLYAQLRLGWSHEYADVSRPVTASLAGAPGFLFTTYGASPRRDGAVVGLSMTTAIANASSLYLRYEGNVAGQDSTHALTAGLRMTW
jgi:uncharacterized protein with beta-barrel porin domain